MHDSQSTSKYYRAKWVALPSARMTERVRRSSRIQKKLPILLVGSDMDGRVFSEKTSTVVLSRHGAGIISEYTLSAEQELIIRLVGSNKEAEVRLVGQLAEQDGKYIYGVAFLDANLNFWGMEFPPPSDAEKAAGRKILECSSCKGREMVDQSDVEADVFMINESVIRYCKSCGSSTMWRAPSGNVEPIPDTQEGEPEAPTASPSLAPVPIEQPAGAPPSVTLEPVSQPAVGQSQDSPAPASVRQENRRKHVRTKVSFKACVKGKNSAKDIVTCEDISRGGLRFKSRKRYAEQQMIEVAAPYDAGSQNIFVSARVVFVTELPKEKFFRCGVEYLSETKQR
jgi:PilZ domain